MRKGTIIAVAIVGALAVIGVVLGVVMVKTQRGPEVGATVSSETTPPPEPNDELAAQGGDQPLLLLTGWDAAVGRGGTISGVMEPGPQKRLTTGLEADYRKTHDDAPRMLRGAIREGRFDAPKNRLTFIVTIKGTKYGVSYDAGTQQVTARTEDGRRAVSLP